MIYENSNKPNKTIENKDTKHAKDLILDILDRRLFRIFVI